MSLRSTARELYRVMKQVQELEKQLESPASGSPQRDRLEDELRVARAERDRIKNMLDGAKSQ